MRKLLVFLLLAAVAAIALYRQRLFLRDPLGKVLVNGVAVEGAQVFINYTNDVLTQFPDGRPSVIVQGWDRTPGSPEQLVCWRALACLAPGDHAPKVPLGQTDSRPQTSMNDRVVIYRGGAGESVRIVIR